MKFIIEEIETKKQFVWSIKDILNEINRDTSDKWTPYDESDWKEGWYSWAEGDYYKLIKTIP